MRAVLLLLALWAPLAAAADFRIVTASPRGTYIQVARDLAEKVAKPAGLDLEVLPSAGSAENIQRLRYEPGVKLALVQSDVYQAFLDAAASGDREAGKIITPLRVVLPLYEEEIYFLVRADSPLQWIHEIRGQRINAGPLGSGTALTTATLYRLMYQELLPSNASFLSNEDGLVKLLSDKTVDVVAIVAGQPAKVLADIKPEAKPLLRMLKLDANHPTTKASLSVYFSAIVRKISYPNLLDGDVLSLSVKALLVTYDFTVKQSATAAVLVKLAKSLCTRFGDLQESGHSKWRDVDLALPDLGAGWRYYEPTSREINACIADRARSTPAPIAPAVQSPPPSGCSLQHKVLGLCT